MCILFIYVNPKPQPGGYRLVIASNRDETYKRPARGAFQCPQTGVIGGRDMEPGREGGMWLGISLKGEKLKFGALLNVTGADKRSASKGRGFLVYNFLKGAQSSPLYFNELELLNTYSSFNLVTVELDQGGAIAYHHSNDPDAATIEYGGPQILAFGNSNPQVPLTKVTVGKRKFTEIIEKSTERDQLIADLVGLLKCEDRELPDLQLEQRAPQLFEALSQIFVNLKREGFGTRTHSVVLVDFQGRVHFVEHTMRQPINVDQPEWDVTHIQANLN